MSVSERFGIEAIFIFFYFLKDVCNTMSLTHQCLFLSITILNLKVSSFTVEMNRLPKFLMFFFFKMLFKSCFAFFLTLYMTLHI
jgi:hypothetical protein